MDFRKKLLVLSASAMAFAGLASAQTQLYPCGAGDTGSANTTGLPNILRLEGTNDLVADLTVSCAKSSTLTKGTVTIVLNATVTSKTVSSASEATLQVTGETPIPGVVSGNQITFAQVTFPATAFTMTVSNVRVNSSLLASGTYVTGILNVYNQGVVAYSTSQTQPTVAQGGVPINLGYVQQGFAVPTVSGVQNYTLCQQGTDPSFTITLKELFGGAFKGQTPGTNVYNNGTAYMCGGGTCSETNGEQGSYVPSATGAIGTASSGTRFLFTFSGIPSGVTLYLPVEVTSGTLEMALTGGGATGPFSAVTAGMTVAGDAAISASNGTATAVYEVVQTDNTIPNESIGISGTFGYANNFTSTAIPAITATVDPAPTGSTNVPNFIVENNPALTLSAWTPCQTTLLFPFVTNQDSFDTGIVLSNTSTDPFGKLGASPSSGTCSLNFYGSGAPSPNTSVAAPGGSQASGTANAFVLSSVAPGFQGYMIAVCNYLFGHGYAFIEYDLTQQSGVAEGYLPLIITDRNGASKELNEELNN